MQKMWQREEKQSGCGITCKVRRSVATESDTSYLAP